MADKQIHELTAISRSPESADMLAVDTGSMTGKMTYSTFKTAVNADAIAAVNALSAAVVHVDAEQVLTDAQKATARENIGAVDDDDLAELENTVNVALMGKVDIDQGAANRGKVLVVGTDGNVSLSSPDGTVRYDTAQSLTDAQKVQARTNIGGASESDIGELKNTLSNQYNIPVAWEQGRLSNSGTNVSSNYGIRTIGYFEVGSRKNISVLFMDKPFPSGATQLRFRVFEYSSISPLTYVKRTNVDKTEPVSVTLDETTKYLRFDMQYFVAGQHIITPDMGVLAVPVWNDSADILATKNLVENSVEAVKSTVDYTQNALPDNTDVDTIVTNGLWFINSLYTYDNLPAGVNVGIIINRMAHTTGTNVRMQIICSGNDKLIYYRYRNAIGWSDWKTGLEEFQNKISKIPNMYNKQTDTTGYTINSTGEIEANQYFEYSDAIPVLPNTRYYVYSHASGVGTARLRVHSYRTTSTDVQTSWIRKEAEDSKVSVAADQVCNFITAPDAAYIRISVRMTNTGTFAALGSYTQSNGVSDGNNQVLTPMRSFSLRGKKLSVLGASISTFSGYIPQGYNVYYPHETSNAYPVADVHDTYWMKVIDATGMELLVDNASAGSYCTTGHGADSLAGCGTRCESLDDGTNYPDVIIIQLGGNDFTRSTPLGSYDGTQEFPTTTDTFREAYAVMLGKITTKYKSAKVFCGTIPIIRGGTYVTNTFPAKNKNQGEGKPGGIMIEEYNQVIREMSALFGCKVVEFSRCGLTFNNVSEYMQDYVSSIGYGQHPNRFGHSMMANEILHALGQEFGEVYPVYS